MQPFDDGLAAQLETKWIDAGQLAPEELTLLETNRVHNTDAAVRERCRVILDAVAKRADVDPRVDALLCARNWAAFTKLIRPLPGDERQP